MLNINKNIACQMVMSLGLFFSADAVEIRITNDVAVEDVKRIGMNFNDTGWDAGSVAQKRTVFNFEGTMYRSIYWGPRQDATGLFTWQDPTRPSEDFRVMDRTVGARYTVLNGPAKGEQGLITAVERRSFTEDGRERELAYLVFDRELPANPGSHCAVMIEKDGLMEGHFNVSGVGTGGFWSSDNLSLEQGDTAPESFGNTALKMDAREGRSFIKLPGRYTEFGEVRGDWALSFRAKSVEGSPKVRITAPDNRDVLLKADWSEHSFTFNVKETPGDMVFAGEIEVTGGSILIDDVVFRHVGSNPTAFSDLFVQTLQELRPGILRYLQMGGSTVENSIRPPLEQFRFTSSPWMKGGPSGGPFSYKFSMHEFFELCAHVGADPWFSLPGVIHVEELEQFMEYVAAPADTGMGRLRARLGQVEPWTEVFDEIIVEFGNEAWNQWGPFAAGGYSGPEYWQDLFEAGKSSKWMRENILFASAGQNVNHWTNRQIIRNAPNADLFAIATYLIHHLHPEVEERLEGNTPELYRWLFGVATGYLIDHPGMKANVETTREHGLELAVYETNHHAADGAASSEFRNRFLSSLGGGLNMAQNHLIMLQEHGARNQAFFTMFGHVNNAYKVKDVRLFGAVLRMKNEETRVRPHFLALRAMNQALMGDLLRVEFGEDMPMFTAPSFDEKSKEWGTPRQINTVRALPFAEGNRRSLILLNLSVEDPVPVTIGFDGAPVGGLGRCCTRMTSTNNELEQEEAQVHLYSREMKPFRSGQNMKRLTVLRWESNN